MSDIPPYEHLKVQIHKIHDLGRCNNVKPVYANGKKRSGRKIHYSPQKHGRQWRPPPTTYKTPCCSAAKRRACESRKDREKMD